MKIAYFRHRSTRRGLRQAGSPRSARRFTLETVRPKRRARSLPTGPSSSVVAADAVAGVDQIHLTLSDDTSVDAVLEAAAERRDRRVDVDRRPARDERARARANHVSAGPTRQTTRSRSPCSSGTAVRSTPGGLMMTSCSQANHDALKPALEADDRHVDLSRRRSDARGIVQAVREPRRHRDDSQFRRHEPPRRCGRRLRAQDAFSMFFVVRSGGR